MNCADCTQQERCGWCDTRCVVGNFSSPSENIPCEDYIYLPNQCQKTSCLDFTTCSVCTQQPNCGWCNETVFEQQTCLPGTKTDPNGDCELRNWYVDDCPGMFI